MERIYCFNELFQLVRNDRLTNYQFVTHWLENKRDVFVFSEKKGASYISPEGFAQWTLCDRESVGTNNVMNLKKMEDLKKHFLQEYASNDNTSCETNHSIQSGKPRSPNNQFGLNKTNKKGKNLKKHIC